MVLYHDNNYVIALYSIIHSHITANFFTFVHAVTMGWLAMSVWMYIIIAENFHEFLISVIFALKF